ncbi:MAG: hypothetical protein SF162_16815 [bacterium]|nr:hypothetical protein [bacterium]
MDPYLSQALRVIFLVLHILSAVAWLSGLFADLVFNRLIRSNNERANVIALRMAQNRLGGFAGQLGGIGILITGFGLIGVAGYGFLGLINPTPSWLVVKQVVYLLAFVLALALIQPASRRLGGALAEAARGGDVAAAQALAVPLERYALFSHLLVIVNIVFAVWKPTWFVVGG